MTKPIKRVAVLGAGVMGSGIAAHLANTGVSVLLLDILPPKLDENKKDDPAARNAFALGALKKMLKGKPASFTHPSHEQLVQVGNFDDDLEKIAACDLVIEAIIEKLEIKRSLFEKLESITAESETIIASNTSGLRISDMLEGRSDSFCERFLVMHFFNPPRYMKLLELVRSPTTSDAVYERVEHLGREILGKGIVLAKDSPNFVANRIGTHSMMSIIHLMLEMDLTPEDIDAISGVPMGHPKSATFRTGDLVGLDTLAHVVNNCHAMLTDDEERDVFQVPSYMQDMLKAGRLGRKSKAGFYRKTPAGIETLDPKTGEYRSRGGDGAIRSICKSLGEISDPKKRVRKLLDSEGAVGELAWKALSRSLAYAARRVGEISDDIAAIDAAMRWGFNWEIGPFETWDALGFADTAKRMENDGIDLPETVKQMLSSGASGFYADDRVYHLAKADYLTQRKDPREISLAQMRQGDAAVLSNPSAEAWDLGDDVLGITFTSKANTLDADNIELIHQAIERAERDFRGVLIFNQGEHFGLGANLFLVAAAAAQKEWGQVEQMSKRFQDATQYMKYARVPVVAAPFGMAVGGGCELCLGSDSVQAACETYAGLVEVGVGLIPGGGGTLNMLWRSLASVPEGVENDVYAHVTQVFKNIAMAKVATSAAEAKHLGYFHASDGVSFDRARQLYEAKQRVLLLARSGYQPPIPRAYKLPGESGVATLKMLINTMIASGFATDHDGLIAGKLAHVLCGGVGGAAGKVTEQQILDLEREAFVSLCGEAKSQERMQHMLMKNKPLRN